MPTHKDLPDDRHIEADDLETGLRIALRTCFGAFVVVVFIMLALYCVWVLALVYGPPADVQIQECSQVPVGFDVDLC